MSTGEFLTRVTVWIALSGYAVGAASALLARSRKGWDARARWGWTVGCVGLVTHVICAFSFYHHWSHDSAYRETARQTAEVVGLNWGGGLFINYAFVLAWLLEVAWWWRGDNHYWRRPQLVEIIWQGFFIFMIFNATVVFKTGPLRWLGLMLCAGLAILWWAVGRTQTRQPQLRPR